MVWLASVMPMAFKLGDEASVFHPYGASLIESAAKPAHQLRLMKDAKVVYRGKFREADPINRNPYRAYYNPHA